VTHVWTHPYLTDDCSITIQSTKTTQKWRAVAGSGERKVATKGLPDGWKGWWNIIHKNGM